MKDWHQCLALTSLLPALATPKTGESGQFQRRLRGNEECRCPTNVRRPRRSRVRAEEEAFDWPEVSDREQPKAIACEGARAFISEWLRVNRARRHIEVTLRPHALSFPLWWLLLTTAELIHETADAISQQAVCHRTDLDKATVSYLMGVLAERGLVDRGPEFGGNAYRIWVTKDGEALLAESSLAIESALARAPIAQVNPDASAASRTRRK